MAAELNNKIRILFFIASMISSVSGLEISILDILSDFKCKTKIIAKTFARENKYNIGTALDSYHYEAYYPKSTVIAYIVDETRFEEIANPEDFEIRMEIGEELRRKNHELVVFGINNFQNYEFDLISKFLYVKIKPHPEEKTLEIVTMGEESFDQTYCCRLLPFKPLGKYKEKSRIYNGHLQEHLRRSFPKMAYRSKRPDPINIKEVRFFENLIGRREYHKEETWPLSVRNGEYIPGFNVSLTRMENNFMRRYNVSNVHILIVGGKDYMRLTTDKLPWFEEMRKIMDKMKKNNEILFLMGCFNFDWSEIGIVSQIILTHSTSFNKREYNVFTAGIGMFDTVFHNSNENDERQLRQSSNNDLMEFVKKCSGGTIRRKSIEIFNLNASNITKNEIVLSNGRYELRNYHLKRRNPNARLAFIVIDSTEMNDLNVFSVAKTLPQVRMFQSNDIELFLLKLDNFKSYDLHIIPEWIENNRGKVRPNRIAVLGGGSCSTIFQFVSSEYQITYTFNVANELKEIRNAFVATADDKSIILANINVPNFGIQKFPMHRINGFYDPVVLSENDMISTAGNAKILFLIVEADKFMNMINAVQQLHPSLITNFRQRIANDYPLNGWTVYLVGLDNFGEKDLHLFAEFVKCFTNDRRPLWKFVHTFGDGIYQSMYEFRDVLPFFTSMNMPMAGAFTDFFHLIDVISILNK